MSDQNIRTHRHAVCPRCHRATFLLRADSDLPSYCPEWLSCNFKPSVGEPWLIVECEHAAHNGTGRLRNRRLFMTEPGVVQYFASQLTAGLAYASHDLYLFAEANRYLSWMHVGLSVIKPSRTLGMFVTEGSCVQQAVNRYCIELGKPYPYRKQKRTQPAQGKWSLRQLSKRARAGEAIV